eukprot:5683374-Alexandrium_andersonii.AAC.1
MELHARLAKPLLVGTVQEAMERRPGVIIRDYEGFMVIQNGKAELPNMELPEVRNLVLTVPAEALIVARSIGATEHHIRFKVLLVLSEVGVDALDVSLKDMVRGGSLGQARHPPRELGGAVAAGVAALMEAAGAPVG